MHTFCYHPYHLVPLGWCSTVVVRSENCSGQRVAIISIKKNAILLYNTMPAESLVKVVKRNEDVSLGEILDRKKGQI